MEFTANFGSMDKNSNLLGNSAALLGLPLVFVLPF